MKWKEEKKVSNITDIGMVQDVYRFTNGYGASVVRGPYSYGGDQGLYELAVIKFVGPGDYDFTICYDTPITNDVIGHLTEEEVEDKLQEIKTLKVPGKFRNTLINIDNKLGRIKG